MRAWGLLAVLPFAVLGLLAGCGDSSGGFAGCGTDNDCKGDRICVQGQCVDPSDAAGGDGGASGTSGGNGGTSGSGSGGTEDGGMPGSGTGGGGGGGAGGSTPIDDPALEAACIADCEAKHAAGCEMGVVSVDQCTGQCLVIDEVNDGYCNEEQSAQYACLASGGYTCLQGYPQPKSTCIQEAQTLATCYQELPCRRFCEVAADTSCGADASTCFDDCRTEEQGFEDFICSYDYDQLLTCWSQGLVCDGGLRSIEGCETQAASVADCIGLRQSECEGYCWAAELLGCGAADCVSGCQAKVDDVACGYLYRRLVECAWSSRDALHLSCVNGEPTLSTECDADAQMYDTCVTP